MLEQLSQAPLDHLASLGLLLSQSHCLYRRDSIEVEGLTRPRDQFGPCFHPLFLDQVEHPVAQLRLSELLVLPGKPKLVAG